MYDIREDLSRITTAMKHLQRTHRRVVRLCEYFCNEPEHLPERKKALEVVHGMVVDLHERYISLDADAAHAIDYLDAAPSLQLFFAAQRPIIRERARTLIVYMSELETLLAR